MLPIQHFGKHGPLHVIPFVEFSALKIVPIDDGTLYILFNNFGILKELTYHAIIEGVKNLSFPIDQSHRTEEYKNKYFRVPHTQETSFQMCDKATEIFFHPLFSEKISLSTCTS